MREVIKCSTCEYCKGNDIDFTCEHPNKEYIHKFCKANNIHEKKYICYKDIVTGGMEIKTAPRWCPRKEKTDE